MRKRSLVQFKMETHVPFGLCHKGHLVFKPSAKSIGADLPTEQPEVAVSYREILIRKVLSYSDIPDQC